MSIARPEVRAIDIFYANRRENVAVWRLLFPVLLDHGVNQFHTDGLVELRRCAVGTLVHTCKVHVDDAYGTCVAAQPVNGLLVGTLRRFVFIKNSLLSTKNR